LFVVPFSPQSQHRAVGIGGLYRFLNLQHGLGHPGSQLVCGLHPKFVLGNVVVVRIHKCRALMGFGFATDDHHFMAQHRCLNLLKPHHYAEGHDVVEIGDFFNLGVNARFRYRGLRVLIQLIALGAAGA